MDSRAAEILWAPSQAQIEQANLTRFIGRVSQSHGSVDDFEPLYAWSIEHPEQFWPEVWNCCGIRSERRWDQVVEGQDRMPGARWFVGARLNFAQNLLRYRDDHLALVFWNEQGLVERLSYAQLYEQVRRLAHSLKGLGIRPGDRVAGYVSNCPEAVIAMLAASSLGAVWSSCSPDFGVQGVLDRFGQIEPKVLVATSQCLWSGKVIDCMPRIRQVAERIGSLQATLVIAGCGASPDLSGLPNARRWEEVLEAWAHSTSEEICFEQLPFDHPLYILYSSGTTGLPKCMVHGAGGTLIQHLKELVLHCDLKRQDRIFYYTTCGWMMWNWLVSSLATGATLLLYDGSPLPAGRKEILFDLAQEEGMTVFGTSARYIAMAEKEGLKPRRTHDLAALQSMLSTGSVLAPEGFDYVYRHIKADLRLSSISGGTDLVSCFALGNPIRPVYRGELQTAGLGMKVEVYDEQGKPLPVGEPGELVCTMPFPSMPVRFWNDPDGSKYRSAYFEYFPGVWRHGDWIERTEGGGFIFYGRSDATLNPAGVRIGTAEIYRLVEQFDEVVESLVVGQDWQGDTRVVLFVHLADGNELSEQLRQRIRSHIRQSASPRHVPAKIVQVPAIPRTLSGKITELAVRKAIHGQPVQNVEALANPESLQHFRGLKELES